MFTCAGCGASVRLEAAGDALEWPSALTVLARERGWGAPVWQAGDFAAWCRSTADALHEVDLAALSIDELLDWLETTP